MLSLDKMLYDSAAAGKLEVASSMYPVALVMNYGTGSQSSYKKVKCGTIVYNNIMSLKSHIHILGKTCILAMWLLTKCSCSVWSK